jgi:hypothetical protein
LTLLVVALSVSGCAAAIAKVANKQADAPSFFTEVTATGVRYAHNWPERPCFTIDLAGTSWKFVDSTADNVPWERGTEVLRVYLTDNRTARFAVADMDIEEVLRAFMAYELEYVQPWFEFQVSHSPRMAEDYNGIWMQWGWEGHAGKRRAARVDQPADQRHVIQSLWVDPWVLSLDWATTDLAGEPGTTPANIDTLESVTFYPDCFKRLEPGSTWRQQAGSGGNASGMSARSAQPAMRRSR